MDEQPQATPPAGTPPAPASQSSTEPPAAPPPPLGWAQAAPEAPRGGVTGLARIGALILLIGGLFWTAVGGLVIVGGSWVATYLSDFGIDTRTGTDVGDIIGGALVAVGVVIAGVAILEVIVAILAWRGNGFGRVMGVLYGLFFGSLALLSLAGERTAASETGAMTVLLVIGVAYLYAGVILIVRYRGAR